MDSLVRDHDERTFLLGHSLGCITILRQLSRLPASAGVTSRPTIMALAPRRVVVASRDDAIVPYRYCQHLSETAGRARSTAWSMAVTSSIGTVFWRYRWYTTGYWG
ncbi:UNVERIFIED_CONTAM: hypothetical protein K2H54_000209 [Gekko kuhli]